MRKPKLKIVLPLTYVFFSQGVLASNAYNTTAANALKIYTGDNAILSQVSCTSCHAGVPALSKFGQDLKANGLSGNGSATASSMNLVFMAVKDLDSDADTYKNDLEFKGSSDPGDASSKPGGGGGGPVVTPIPTPTPVSGGPTGGGGTNTSQSADPGNSNGAMLEGGCGSKMESARSRLKSSAPENEVAAASFWLALMVLPIFVSIQQRKRR